MQHLRLSGAAPGPVAPAFTALLVTRDGALGPTARRLRARQAMIEVIDEIYGALSMLIDDPRLADLVVVDCDGFGGAGPVRQALAQAGQDERRAPVILLSQDCGEQTFPSRRGDPVLLRAPLSPVALHLALETLLRGRFSLYPRGLPWMAPEADAAPVPATTDDPSP